MAKLFFNFIKSEISDREINVKGLRCNFRKEVQYYVNIKEKYLYFL